MITSASAIATSVFNREVNDYYEDTILGHRTWDRNLGTPVFETSTSNHITINIRNNLETSKYFRNQSRTNHREVMIKRDDELSSANMLGGLVLGSTIGGIGGAMRVPLKLI